MNKEIKKQYRLLRELPDAKVGTIFTEDGKGYYDYNSTDGSDSFYSSDEMENNPSWFEEVIKKDVYIDLPAGAMHFLKAMGQCFTDGESEYYNVHFWYKFVENNVAIQYTPEDFDNLPSRKEWLSMQGEQPKHYEILLWKAFNGLFSTKKFAAPCVIHSIKRLSDNTTWFVGKETVWGDIIKIEIDNKEVLTTFKNTTNKYLKNL